MDVAAMKVKVKVRLKFKMGWLMLKQERTVSHALALVLFILDRQNRRQVLISSDRERIKDEPDGSVLWFDCRIEFSESSKHFDGGGHEGSHRGVIKNTGLPNQRFSKRSSTKLKI
jgi:hypothetical protein